MERLTKTELDDYFQNAGLTQLQKNILKMRYFDDDTPSVIMVCRRLHISETAFYYAQRKLLKQIKKYNDINNCTDK